MCIRPWGSRGVKTNGLVEIMNGTIQRAICKLVNTKTNEWDKHLDAVMYGLRNKKQMTTKFSPFYQMFGREARYPSQVPEEYRIDNSVEEVVTVEDLTDLTEPGSSNSHGQHSQGPKEVFKETQRASGCLFCG